MDLFERLEQEMAEIPVIESKTSTVTIVQPFLTLLCLFVVPCLCVLSVAGTYKILTVWF